MALTARRTPLLELLVEQDLLTASSVPQPAMAAAVVVAHGARVAASTVTVAVLAVSAVVELAVAQ